MFRYLILALLLTPAGAQVTDSFAGTGALSGNWTQTSASGNTTITRVSGAAQPTSSTQGMAVYTGTTFPNDQQVQAVLTGNIGGNVCVHMDTAGDEVCYLPEINRIYVLTAGAGAHSVASGCTAPTTGQTIKLTVVGNTYTAFNNGVQACQGSDSTYTSGHTGIYVDQATLAGSGLSNFAAGPYTAFSLSPTAIINGSTGNVISLTGVGTTWTSTTPTFTVTGVSATKTSQTILTDTTATITVSAGGTNGTATVTDPSTGLTAPLLIVTPKPWYIRTDGGTASQCTGLTNAAYPGSGSAQNCGLIHPFWLMSQSSRAWRSDYTAGDTVNFDVGPYYIGTKTSTSSSRGTNWNAAGFSWCPASGFGSDCDFPPIPDYSLWLGANVGHCNQTVGGGSHPTQLLNPTVFEAINGVFWLTNVQSSQSVTMSCFRLTQPDSCTQVGTGTGQCNTGNDFASIGVNIAYQAGTQGPANLTLTDIEVYGIGQAGLHGSKWNRTGSDVSRLTNVFLRGNGNAGWDSDNGGCTTDCESVGFVTGVNVWADFNGCVWNIPGDTLNSTTHTPSNGVNFCYDQSFGGNGDGIVLLASNDVHWSCDYCFARWNTQDGFDLLHLGDDITHHPVVNVSHDWSEGNEGQAFKIGIADTTAYSNIAIMNCHVLLQTTVFPMTLNPSGYAAGLGNDCRAQGDQWAIYINDGRTISMIHNSTFGYGTTMYDIGCANSCTTNAALIFRDNISVGYADPNSGTFAAGFCYLLVSSCTATDPFSYTGSAIDHNNWFNVRAGSGGGICPQDTTYETNAQCLSPVVANQLINSIDPHLTSSSTAVIGLGVTAGLTTDYYGTNFLSPPAIGGVEFGSAPPSTYNRISLGSGRTIGATR